MEEVKMFNQMNKFNTCIFSTSNNTNYAIECLNRLDLARKFAQECPVYLIGSYFDQTIHILAKAKNIKLIEVGDKNGYFEKEWEYPKECYYWALSPLLLPEKYGIYIDGDVYCRKDPFLDLNKTPVESIAGITLSMNPGLTEKDIKMYSKNFNYEFGRKRINSGVLYLNLEYLRKAEFTKEISNLFNWSIKNNVPRKGDDSLLYVFIKTHNYPYTYLPIQYNWIRALFGDPVQDVVWFHANKG